MIEVRIVTQGIKTIAINDKTHEVVAEGGLDYVMYCLNYKGLDGKNVYKVILK